MAGCGPSLFTNNFRVKILSKSCNGKQLLGIKLSMDIAGPKRDYRGHTFYIVALIDDHSRYVVAQVIRSVTTKHIIQFLSTTFTYFGFCGKLTTNSGVQFTSVEFAEYLRRHGIAHIRSAIYNPRANGSIERVNKTLKKLLSILKTEGVALTSLQQSLNSYLLNYNSIHETTSYSFRNYSSNLNGVHDSMWRHHQLQFLPK